MILRLAIRLSKCSKADKGLQTLRRMSLIKPKFILFNQTRMEVGAEVKEDGMVKLNDGTEIS